MAQQRNSLLCPNCRRLISADEPQCPYCGLSAPGARWKHAGWTRVLGDGRLLVKWLIYVNVGIYAVALLFGMQAGASMGLFGMLSPSSQVLLELGATGVIPIGQLGRWWSLLSANYLHAGIMHIAFNMMALSQLGPLIAATYGPYRMFAIWTIGGTFGFFVSVLAGVPFTVGASASVCALLGAALYYSRSRGGEVGAYLFRQIGTWVVINMVIGFLVPAINNWAHGGGIAGGAALGLLLGYRERKPDKHGHRVIALVCAGVTVAVLGWAVFTTVARRFI